MENNDLHSAGLKATTPRLKILWLLENAKEKHMTAEAIYRKIIESGAEIGLATVYRALTQFEAAGLITRHHFEGGQTVFELERGPHHDHIVCVYCGRVEEFYDKAIEERQRVIAAKLGFTLCSHALTLYGECNDPKCPGKKKNSKHA